MFQNIATHNIIYDFDYYNSITNIQLNTMIELCNLNCNRPPICIILPQHF